jgi:(2Fe-2S) ferredoxin
MQGYAKGRIKALGLNGKGQVRINKAGCLDRCEEGPVLVVYPDAVWYGRVQPSDVDEIIDAHILGGKPVARLLIPDDQLTGREISDEALRAARNEKQP